MNFGIPDGFETFQNIVKSYEQIYVKWALELACADEAVFSYHVLFLIMFYLIVDVNNRFEKFSNLI